MGKKERNIGIFRLTIKSLKNTQRLMKKNILQLVFCISSFFCIGQSLFFDNLNNSIWKSDENYNDSSIRTTKEIGLSKLINSPDVLINNVTIWEFKNDTLTIYHFDCNSRKDSLIATYRYETNAEKGIINIILNENEILEYKVGIISTGSHALLVRNLKRKNE